MNFAHRSARALTLFLCLFASGVAVAVDFPAFDRGPDLENAMQEELIEILDEMPYLPGISQQLQVLAPAYQRGQKTRPDFGTMPLRGFLIPNSISVLAIGQDGTHIAEGANRPGIAAFGGRVHDILKHFGIVEGVFFTNLYVNTITGQYGSRDTPVLKNDKTIEYRNVIENRQWLMTHQGPYGEWRNKFLSWVIRNNMKSLKMVVMLGNAGKDAGASFINSIGGKVSASERVGDGSQYLVPMFKMVGAGGNSEFAVAVTEDGKDVAELLRRDDEVRNKLVAKLQKKIDSNEEKMKTADEKKQKILKKSNLVLKKRIAALNKPLNYRDGSRKAGISTENAKALLKANVKKAKEMMVFSRGGPKQNGVLYPQQFGGWDLKTMTVFGKKTRSIKGLRISCNDSQVGVCSGKKYVIAPDIVFSGSPHPTSLSMNEQDSRGSAAKTVKKDFLDPLLKEVARGWEPPAAEEGLESSFLDPKKPYKYGRALIPRSHGDPGITDLRLLPVSTAKRAGKSVIVIGTTKLQKKNKKGKIIKEGAVFNKKLIRKMEKAVPSQKWLPLSHEVLTGRPQIAKWSDKYDRGPSDDYAKLLFQSLDKSKVLWVKKKHDAEAQKVLSKALSRFEDPTIDDRYEAYQKAVGSIFNKYGIAAFNYKSHPDAGFFGHYRGTFDSPEVLVLSDPHGYDSFITSKAATGERGQYLNGLLSDLGVKSNYLVLSTVPMAMDGATKTEWQQVLATTADYRRALIEKVIEDSNPSLILADGPYAAAELKKILGEDAIVEIPRKGKDASYGFLAAAKEIEGGEDVTGELRDIPREHLTWIARTWEGTSGDRVITSSDDKFKGKAFAIVAPNWARKNEVHFSERRRQQLVELQTQLIRAGEPQAGESIRDYVVRRAECLSVTELKRSKDDAKLEGKICDFAEPLVFPGE